MTYYYRKKRGVTRHSLLTHLQRSRIWVSWQLFYFVVVSFLSFLLVCCGLSSHSFNLFYFFLLFQFNSMAKGELIKCATQFFISTNYKMCRYLKPAYGNIKFALIDWEIFHAFLCFCLHSTLHTNGTILNAVNMSSNNWTRSG